MVGVSSAIMAIFYLLSFVDATDNIQELCSSLGDYTDCSSKNLKIVPSNIKNWTQRLNLNNNSISALDEAAWLNLTQVIELKLNKNKLHSIQKGTFENMKKLAVLELNRNQLDNIEPLSFQHLEHLNSLKLRKNKFRELRDGSFFGLTQIKSLLLDYNYVEVIKKGWLYGLDNLKELSLSYNLIHTIENTAWEFCKELVDLNLSYNQLKAIKKDTFKDLPQLQKLVLNNNNITFIEENAFVHITNLKILYLSNNKISWTIEDGNGVFRGLNNLVKFYIASNDIKSVNKNAFNGLHKVNYLDLKNNNITSIQRNAFSDMPLQNLSLNTKSLLCDCNIQWFYEYMNLKKLNIQTECAYPEWLRGYSLLNVPPNNFTCDDLPKPRIFEEPVMEIKALKGESILLVCKAMSSSSSPMIFLWKRDNVELHNADVTTTATVDGKKTEGISYLKINKVQHSDAGKYQCVVSNSYGSTYSQKSSISVLIYPTFNKMPSNLTVQAGIAARLECSASGEPQPEIAWQKDGGNDFPAARERRMQVMPEDDVFFIINSKPSDMGVYSCTARNAAGTIVANATLTIEEKPSFVKPMEDKEITVGESVVIQCMASGAPKPMIQWLKDGVPITATERHFFTAEEQLMIIIDTVSKDGGIYTCNLNNSLGVETGYSTLVVKQVLMSYSDMLGIIVITVVSCAVFTSIIWVVIIYQTRRRMGSLNNSKTPPAPPMMHFPEKIVTHFGDNTSEHSSCKDSGTGDSAKRSNDDLLPGEEYTLIINETNPSDKNSTMRAASLVYLPTDINSSQTPLLYSSTAATFPVSTNHDRLQEPVDINAITIEEVSKE